MRRNIVVALGVLTAASPLAAQDNPFAFTGGSIKSAYIVYDLASKDGPVQGATWESGVAPDRWIVRLVMPVDLGGKKDTMRSLVIVTRDSQYKYNTMGSQRGEGEVSPTLRFHLGRAYAALDAAGKARFKQNLRLGLAADNSSASDDMDAFITLTGDKVGSETVAGHKCDVYKRKTFTACVMPQAPMVMLKWSDAKQNMNLVARKVTLNGPIPTVASLRPKAVRWKKEPYDDADFILGIWTLKKQTDPSAVPGATLAQFAVKYLAGPGTAAELREMSGGGDEEAEAPAEESAEDGDGT
ncbi:MAG TPA: hypothetical protein VGP44_02445 [Gemmatimonadales bacterium]|nr:hypothetical protein [Gemmatimonadales bacterium]